MTDSASGKDRDWVDREDTRKLHAEINQLSNQRFLVVTVSITFFAIANTGLLSKWSPASGPKLLLMFSYLWEVFLFFLFYLIHKIRHVSRCEATYLIAIKATNWEIRWREFRAGKYSGMRNIELWLFTLLMIAQAAIPFIVLASGVCKWPQPPVSCFLWFLPAVTIAVILLIHLANNVNEAAEEQALNGWRAILSKQPNSSAANEQQASS